MITLIRNHNSKVLPSPEQWQQALDAQANGDPHCLSDTIDAYLAAPTLGDVRALDVARHPKGSRYVVTTGATGVGRNHVQARASLAQGRGPEQAALLLV